MTWVKTGRYSKSPSIILLNPLILLKPLFPQTKSLAAQPLFLLSLISRRHCFKSVPFRCSRRSSCLAGWFINTGWCDPPSEICGIYPAIHKKEQKPEWKHRSKRHPVIYRRGKDANVVLSRFCCVSICEMSMVWRQPYTIVYNNSVIHLWPYAASYCLSGVTDAAENHLEPLWICCRYLLKMPTWMQNMHKIPLDIDCSWWENAKTSERWLPPASWV